MKLVLDKQFSYLAELSSLCLAIWQRKAHLVSQGQSGYDRGSGHGKHSLYKVLQLLIHSLWAQLASVTRNAEIQWYSI